MSNSLDYSRLVVELPRDESRGDLSTNAAMVLAKQIGKPPLELAQKIADQLAKRDEIDKVEIAGPGFYQPWAGYRRMGIPAGSSAGGRC